MDIPKSIKYADAIKLLKDAGFYFKRRKGSHEMWKHTDGRMFMIDAKLGTRKAASKHDTRAFIRQLKKALRGENALL